VHSLFYKHTCSRNVKGHKQTKYTLLALFHHPNLPRPANPTPVYVIFLSGPQISLSELLMLLSVLQQNPLCNQSENVYYQFCSRNHSGTNQNTSTIHLSIFQQNTLWNQSKSATYFFAAVSTLEPIRSRLLSILEQNPLWNQSEAFYYLSCSRIHSGTNQKLASINLGAGSTQEPIRRRLLLTLQQNPLWNQSEAVYSTILLEAESTLEQPEAMHVMYNPSSSRSYSGTNRYE
jgi:hypothetical protein